MLIVLWSLNWVAKQCCSPVCFKATVTDCHFIQHRVNALHLILWLLWDTYIKLNTIKIYARVVPYHLLSSHHPWQSGHDVSNSVNIRYSVAVCVSAFQCSYQSHDASCKWCTSIVDALLFVCDFLCAKVGQKWSARKNRNLKKKQSLFFEFY